MAKSECFIAALGQWNLVSLCEQSICLTQRRAAELAITRIKHFETRQLVEMTGLPTTLPPADYLLL